MFDWLDYSLGQGVTVGMVVVGALVVLALGVGFYFRGRAKARSPEWRPAPGVETPPDKPAPKPGPRRVV